MLRAHRRKPRSRRTVREEEPPAEASTRIHDDYLDEERPPPDPRDQEWQVDGAIAPVLGREGEEPSS